MNSYMMSNGEDIRKYIPTVMKDGYNITRHWGKIESGVAWSAAYDCRESVLMTSTQLHHFTDMTELYIVSGVRSSIELEEPNMFEKLTNSVEEYMNSIVQALKIESEPKLVTEQIDIYFVAMYGPLPASLVYEGRLMIGNVLQAFTKALVNLVFKYTDNLRYAKAFKKIDPSSSRHFMRVADSVKKRVEEEQDLWALLKVGYDFMGNSDFRRIVDKILLDGFVPRPAPLYQKTYNYSTGIIDHVNRYHRVEVL